MATIGELLTDGTARLRASGSETPRLDVELLLGWAVGAERTAIVAHPEAPVGADAAAAFETALGRRVAGEPVAYIRGVKEFHGLAFAVDRRALIPRPETELLVSEAERDVAWRLTSAPRPAGTPSVRVVDVGTGSGAIAVALASLLRKRRMLPEVTILAVDASDDALDLARENAVAHAVADVITFRSGDLVPAAEPPFDLILANLPYIPTRELPAALLPDGTALLEIGYDQGPAVEAAVAALPAPWRCHIQADASGRPRLAHVERSSAGTGPATTGPAATARSGGQ